MNNSRNNIISVLLLLAMLIVAGYFIFKSQTDWEYHLEKEKKRHEKKNGKHQV